MNVYRRIRSLVYQNKLGMCCSLLILMLLVNFIQPWHLPDSQGSRRLNRADPYGHFLQADTLDKPDRDTSQVRQWQKEVRHVAFLKVHKTASSTAQNVFLRFGDSRNLTFALAHVHGEAKFLNVISYTNSITKTNVVPPPRGKYYDILCCHVLYDRKSFMTVFPDDTAYIGIVREPFSRFRSAVRFFSPNYILKLGGPNPVSKYLKNPLNYEPTNPRQSWTNNRMAVEFGFPSELFPNSTGVIPYSGIQSYLNKLDKEFKFIIISEYFHESMVLMKRLLGWKLKDVLYLDQNVGPKQYNKIKQVDNKDKPFFKTFAFLDYALYEFAFHRFWRQLREEGEDFSEELLHYKSVLQTVEDFCLSSSDLEFITVDKTKWNDRFSISKDYCLKYMVHEKKYIQKLRYRQYGTYEN